MVVNGASPLPRASPPAGPSSILPTPGLPVGAAPLGPRPKESRTWAERTAARAAEQAEAEVERERRAVREADQQEMLRRKEEEERRNQPLGGKEWAERVKAIEDRKQERARLAKEAEEGPRTAPTTADVVMKDAQPMEPSPVSTETLAAPPAVGGLQSSIHPSRRGYVQTPVRPIAEDRSPVPPPTIKDGTPVSTPQHRLSRGPSPTMASRQPSNHHSTAGPNTPVTTSLPSRVPHLGSSTDRPSSSSGPERRMSGSAAPVRRERSPPLAAAPARPDVSQPEMIKHNKERQEQDRIEAILADMLRGVPVVDLNRMWGGRGKVDSDAEVSHRPLFD